MSEVKKYGKSWGASSFRNCHISSALTSLPSQKVRPPRSRKGPLSSLGKWNCPFLTSRVTSFSIALSFLVSLYGYRGDASANAGLSSLAEVMMFRKLSTRVRTASTSLELYSV